MARKRSNINEAAGNLRLILKELNDSSDNWRHLDHYALRRWAVAAYTALAVDEPMPLPSADRQARGEDIANAM